MTEDEAKTKWCCGPPAAAFGSVMGSLIKNPKDVVPGLMCQGSVCMAWRWKAERVVSIDGMTQQRTERLTGEFSRTEGFCGLAEGAFR